MSEATLAARSAVERGHCGTYAEAYAAIAQAEALERIAAALERLAEAARGD